MQNNILFCKDFNNHIRWTHGERLHHLFENRCDQFSKAGNGYHLAVDTPEDSWNYKELDDCANQLARYLKAKGLGAGDKIGLLFDKSVHSYISMLAVLKIHAAYVPLDPAFPEDRIAFIANDANLCLILTMSQYRPLTQDLTLPVICVDMEKARIDSQSKNRLDESEIGQPVSELCYIIYTSGSTGRPKGVPIEHASICNFVRVAAEVYGYRATDRVYQGLTIAFDFAVEEIWVPLIVGATLLPNQTGSSLLGSDLSKFLRKQKATAMCCVPTLLATIDEELPDLRLLIVSGEACPRDLIARWYSPKRTILNAYGPTETTVTATLAISKPNEPVTIGKPLPTYSVFILEPGTEKVMPFGEVGEIAIAGVGVAKGYLDREEQTRKAFIKDVFEIPNNPSGRIYRTGDLGRIDENGNVEYHGRIDTQVKIRGYRIELAEIESVMLQVPQIGQAVVDTFEPISGVKELVAYYTLKSSEEPLAQEELVDILRSLLPNYMVPAFYEHLKSIPMLASDKADRKALPKPSGGRMNADENRMFVEPRSQLEKDIAGVLSRLLKLEAVSVEDNFFTDLGANSLLMAHFSAKIKETAISANISMRDIYLNPTIRQLAGHVNSEPKITHSKAKVMSCRIPKVREYYLCGLLQFLFYISTLTFGLLLFFTVIPWVLGAGSIGEVYVRAAGLTLLLFLVLTFIPIALKWILIGKWKPTQFPIWSLKYFGFWVVKRLLSVNPMVAFRGTEFFNIYLRMLGAKIGRNVVILSKYIPVCTDLITIGDDSILRKDSFLLGYKAESGYIRTGRVTIGKKAFIGEATVLDINTTMEDNTQLGHTSSLQEYETIPTGKKYHGSPAQETPSDYCTIEPKPCGLIRRLVYPAIHLLTAVFIFSPVFFMTIFYFSPEFVDNSEREIAISAVKTNGSENTKEESESLHKNDQMENKVVSDYGERINLEGTYRQLSKILSVMKTHYDKSTFTTIHLLIITLVLYVGGISFGLLFVVAVPRLLNLLFIADKTYVLYGIHHYIFGFITGISNSRILNHIFGDSSFIVFYLRAIGYNLSNYKQTGSNFGVEQKHDNPLYCHVGRGTMVSDGLSMINAEFSNSSFRLSKTSIGESNYLGNNIHYPSNGKTGENCLLATKVMIPIDGKIRKNIGLLGSPPFEIPRSVRRDKFVKQYEDESLRNERIKRKNWSNIVTIAIFLFTQWLFIYVSAMFLFYLSIYGNLESNLILGSIAISMFFFFFGIGYFVFVERASLLFKRLKPKFCSIYDPYFWVHERHWKLADTKLDAFFKGTPFKNIISRLLGVKIGKMVFDEGICTEKTLTEIGDYCNINENTTLQAHSLEDGVFKSDYIKIGSGCSIGVNAFVHYGVKIENNVVIDADSFLMKGESPNSKTRWRGNPAREMSVKT